MQKQANKKQEWKHAATEEIPLIKLEIENCASMYDYEVYECTM